MTQEQRAALRALAENVMSRADEAAKADWNTISYERFNSARYNLEKTCAPQTILGLLDALDRAETEKAEAVKAERERCAKLIEENTIWYSNVTGPCLARRVQGDMAGLYYATEIRKEPT